CKSSASLPVSRFPSARIDGIHLELFDIPHSGDVFMKRNKAGFLKSASARLVPAAIAVAIAYFIGVAMDVSGTRPSVSSVYAARPRAAAQQKPQMVEDV